MRREVLRHKSCSLPPVALGIVSEGESGGGVEGDLNDARPASAMTSIAATAMEYHRR